MTIRLKNVHISENDELREGIIADYDPMVQIVELEIFDASERVTEPQGMVFLSRCDIPSGMTSQGGRFMSEASRPV